MGLMAPWTLPSRSVTKFTAFGMPSFPFPLASLAFPLKGKWATRLAFISNWVLFTLPPEPPSGTVALNSPTMVPAGWFYGSEAVATARVGGGRV